MEINTLPGTPRRRLAIAFSACAITSFRASVTPASLSATAFARTSEAARSGFLAAKSSDLWGFWPHRLFRWRPSASPGGSVTQLEGDRADNAGFRPLAAPHDPSFGRRSMPCLTDTTPVHAARQPPQPGAGRTSTSSAPGPPSRVVVWQLVPQLVSRSLIQLELRGPSCWRLRRPGGRQAKVFQDLLHHGPLVRGRSPEQTAGEFGRLPRLRTGRPIGQNIICPTSQCDSLLRAQASRPRS